MNRWKNNETLDNMEEHDTTMVQERYNNDTTMINNDQPCNMMMHDASIKNLPAHKCLLF